MKVFPNPNNTEQTGIDMKDYIAINAMQALIPHYGNPWEMSRRAYEIANAMLATKDMIKEEEEEEALELAEAEEISKKIDV
jgi:hypothetical protein